MDDSVYLSLTLELVSFFNIVREDMEQNINDLSRDLEECNENPNVEVIHTGSAVEGLSLPHLEKQTTWNTDADYMIIRTDLKVFEDVKTGERKAAESDKLEQDLPRGGMERSSPRVRSAEEEINFVYVYDASHAGYVHLAKKKLFQPFDSASVREHCLQNIEFIEESQHLIPLRGAARFATAEGSIAGPAFSLSCAGGTFRVNRDFVYGLRCTFWPSQAEEWLHRDRALWPSSEIISAISTQGCHLVPVGSHNSDVREYEWRFSFSVAELMLARTLSERQKVAYSLLKTLIKSEMKVRGIDVFASYHLKTCLFWFIERKGIESWGKHTLGENIFELLDFFISFYSKGSLPNFFISQNNMIDHRSPKDLVHACEALREIRDTVTQSLCRYIETNQSLPVLFDAPLAQLLKENSAKFAQNCKYNFIVMAIVCIMKNGKSRTLSSKLCVKAGSLVNKARLLHQAAQSEDARANLHSVLAEASEVSHAEETLTANLLLSLLEEYLAVDHLKVTESSAVALAVFNVFLTLHPSHLDPGFEKNSLELQTHLCNPAFKETLFWAARMHEAYSDAIYDFVVKDWNNGPQFHTDDDEAKKFMKLLMVVLGKPTKQASAVTGSLVKRGVEGQRFLMMRMLAGYLLHVHLESSYIAFQAAAYLMDTSVLYEIYLKVEWSRIHVIELILSKPELQAELSEDEFARLVQMHHEQLN
ncbi:cyclic GMP-AMP synthase-like receptor 2 [Montipora capricornis]|uniref:cyclic GMP-AMP synthase-like receptor 2 n=1 Tax=Montipora foliosa TaxID=591990 RepID=UPI0035F1CB7A